MKFDVRVLVWGESRSRMRDWLFITGGPVLGIGSFVLLFRLENEFAFFALFGGPFLASMVNAYLRGGLFVSLATGVPLAIIAFIVLVSVGNVEGAIVPIGVSILSPIIVFIGFTVGAAGWWAVALIGQNIDTSR